MNKNEFLDTVEALSTGEQSILNYFGYENGWQVYPIEYQLDTSWMLNGNTLVYSDEPFTTENIEAGSIYTADTTNRNQSVWRGEDFTMVLADTRCDNNVLLMIFDNENECTDEELKELCSDCW